MEKIKMKLESKLAYYKMIVNSSYGSQSVTDVYSEVFKLRSKIKTEVFKLRSKIKTIKKRKEKIKRLFNGR